jgi:hypothetical protein
MWEDETLGSRIFASTVWVLAPISPLAAFTLLFSTGVEGNADLLLASFLFLLAWFVCAPLGVVIGVHSYRRHGVRWGLLASAASTGVLLVGIVLAFAKGLLG